MQRFRSHVPAGVLLPLFVLALTTLVAVGVSTASADTPTPSPSPTQYPQSTITVRFVNGGQPVTVILGGMVISADGVDCPLGRPDVLWSASQFSMEWPYVPLTSVPECRKGPPTLVRLEFVAGTPADDEVLRLSAEANWEGNDLVLDLNIPDRFVFAPAPTPNGLPSGGGPPEGGSTPAVFLIIAGAAMLVLSAAVAISRVGTPRCVLF